MALKYLSISNLSTVWTKIKAYLSANYQPKGSYSSEGHTHDNRYYTESEINTKLSGKSDTSHNHDDRYYTESEIDAKLSGKSDTSHNHSNYLTDITKAMVTNALGYTPPTQDTTYSKLSQFSNDSGYITSSGSCSYSTTSGTSTYSTYLKSLGAQTPKSGRDIFHSGVYTYTTYTDTNTPAYYGAVIGYGNGQGGSCEMFAQWTGRGNLWFRVLRDYEDSWTNWQQIITSDNIGSQSVNYANSAGSATNTTYANWLRTSSHSDHLFHTEWDGSYFWTYVTAGDGGYRAVRVARSDSSYYAERSMNNGAFYISGYQIYVG